MPSLTNQWTFDSADFTGCPAILQGSETPLMICGTNSGHIVAIDHDRKEHWRTPVGSKPGTWVSVASNEGQETRILAVTVAGKAVCLAPNGSLRWAVDVGASTDPFSSIAMAYGKEGTLVIVTDGKGRATAFSPDDGARLWQFHTGKRAIGPAAIGDINLDGNDEVLFSSGDSFVYCLGLDGSCLWSVKTEATAEYSAPVLVDFGEGPRVLAGSMDDLLRCIDADGKVLWTCRGAGAGSLEVGIAVGDIDGDAIPEVVFVHAGRAIQAVSASGQIIWANTDSGDGDQPFAPSLADVDGDGKLESLLVQRAGTTLRVFSADGVQKENYPLTGTMVGSPVVADIDGDGFLEVLTVNAANGALSCFKSLGRESAWSTSRGNFDGRANALRPRAGIAAGPKKPESLPLLRRFEGKFGLGINQISFDQAPDSFVNVRITGPDGVAHTLVTDSDRPASLEILDCGKHELHAVAVSGNRFLAEISEPFEVDLLLAEQNEAEGLLKQLSLIEGGHNISAQTAKTARFRKFGWFELKDRLSGLASGSADERRGLIGEVRHFVARLRREVSLQKKRVAITVERDAPTEFIPWLLENPWSAFEPETDTPVSEPVSGIPLTTDVRAHEALVVQFANLLDRALEVRVSFDRVVSPAGEKLDPCAYFTLRRVAWVPTATAKMGADALPDLGDAGILPIDAASSARLWVDVATGNLRPGEYSTTLHCRALTPQGATWDIPVRWTVSSLVLPEQMPVRFCNWGYPHSSPLKEIEAATIRDMHDHHTNVFVITRLPKVKYDKNGDLVGDVDWSDHDWILDRMNQDDMLLISPGGLYPAEDAPGPNTPEWERAFSQYLPLWVAHLAEKGFPYDRWAFYPVDEPGLLGGKLTDLLEYYARLYKRIDPRVQVYTDPFKGMTVADLQRVLDVVDIYQLSFGSVLTEASRERYNFLKTTGKTLWTYEAYGGVKDMVGPKYYWEMIWTAWELGLTGVGYWSYCTRGVDLWQGPNPNNNDWEMVYGGAQAPVPSVRVQAIRLGIEDFARMWMVRQAAAKAGDPAHGEALEKRLSGVVSKARESGWDPSLMASLRRELSGLASNCL